MNSSKILLSLCALSLFNLGSIQAEDLVMQGQFCSDMSDGDISECVINVSNFTSFREQADQILASMTLAEKVGQMTQGELSAIEDLSDIADYNLGSVLSGGNADPPSGNSLQSWTDTVNACHRQALGTRLGIPLLYGVDAVHGHNNVKGAVIFPHNIGLGCTRNPKLIRKICHITAIETRTTGVNWTFAPCVAVPRDDRWGRTYEGFSECTALVSEMGRASILGLQGRSLEDPLSILACAKHFVGDGGTSSEVIDAEGEGDEVLKKLVLDQGDTKVSERVLREVHLQPYVEAIRAGVGTIMPSYSSWNGVKCTSNKYLLTDVLKQELGFEGFLISDYNAIDQVNKNFKAAIAECVNAGIDMAMVPDKYREFIKLLIELVEDGEVPEDRIDDAVRRILQVKAAMGLLDDEPHVLADSASCATFGSLEHRRVARDAVRQSIVLLKNEFHTLPLSKKLNRLHVVGRAADDIGIQCGGWTIDWQGKAGNITSGGTTILKGIRKALGPEVEITFDSTGKGAEGADAVIAVVGETPYAEGAGDNHNLTLSAEDLQLICSAKCDGVPLVVVLISGRPMILGSALELADAFIAAWLPGTEGGGIADVVFGDYSPTGKLSFSWPHSANQQPINHGDEDYDPLFKFGFGLEYDNH